MIQFVKDVCIPEVQVSKLIFVLQESVLNGRLEPMGVVEVWIMCTHDDVI